MPVDLSNCDREPIHIPGFIQSHGALLAFDSGLRLTHVSANATDWLGPTLPALGEVLQPHHLEANAAAHALLSQALDADGDTAFSGPAARHAAVTIAGKAFDLLVHRLDDTVVAEFEHKCQTADAMRDYAPPVHGAVQRLRQRSSVQALLEEAVLALRELTGFDRVMAYRFRPDDSGDIVAEARHAALEPYLGQRYPASDIPAQARRLYTINVMRLIAEVDSAPVPVHGLAERAAPLDMSHAELRSVSPIHIEYLQNIGVGASMSLSIVLGGRLWGMLACHHRTPRQVPYSVRAACALLAELLTARLQAQLAADHAAEERTHERLRALLLDRIQYAPQPAAVLLEHAADIARVFRADAVIVSSHSLLHGHGDVAPELRARLNQWLMSCEHPDGHLLATTSIAAEVPELADQLDGWAGAMAICYDRPAHAALLLLRREQIETVNWGHNPNKAYVIGPSGPRLTPPGSFELWRETVRGHSEAWSDIEVASMRQLGVDLVRTVTIRNSEMESQRAAVAAMLAHDGRLPGIEDAASQGRVERLLRQVMDLTMLRQGRVSLALAPVDVVALLAQRVAQAQQRSVGTSVITDLPGRPGAREAIRVRGDMHRLAQLFDSLIDNAVRHGTPGESVVVRVRVRDGQVLAEVSNIGQPLAPAVLQALATGAAAQPQSDSRGGLGYGLYISQAIARAHGGDLLYHYDDPFVTFAVPLPLAD